MAETQHQFVAQQYGPRAADYVTSAVHAGGADLDQIEALVRGRGLSRALDLGCGGGHVAYRLAPHVQSVVALDVTPDMLNVVARTAAERGLANVTVQQGTAEDLPFADARFDAVFSRFSAHHWSDFRAGLAQAARVTARGGLAIFADVVSPGRPLLDTHLQAVELLRDVSHVRNYSLAEWTDALQSVGFDVQNCIARRLRMDFPVWIARTRAGDLHARAIRSLQQGAPDEVRAHFAIEPDGSFMLDAVTIEAVRR